MLGHKLLGHKLLGHDWTFLWKVLGLAQEQAAPKSRYENLPHFAVDAAVDTAEAAAASAGAVSAAADASCLLHQLLALLLATLQSRCHTFLKLCPPAAHEDH